MVTLSSKGKGLSLESEGDDDGLTLVLSKNLSLSDFDALSPYITIVGEIPPSPKTKPFTSFSSIGWCKFCGGVVDIHRTYESISSWVLVYCNECGRIIGKIRRKVRTKSWQYR